MSAEQSGPDPSLNWTFGTYAQAHAAKRLAGSMFRAGHMHPDEYNRIVADANRVMGKPLDDGKVE